ncbi:hypothetical protein [Candidatus Villigracilis saccharophilus]|uniref:hypothetical protein n=1 Tax=Candidatus Villigracilis saccharophilus TaxID=3140684 RepID=UPI0031350920|nr:hypothetical protein [Anaerolineales bacterium]
MSDHIKQEDFSINLLKLMQETFESPHGIFLDKNTSLFQTLESVSAQEASTPVGGKCASLAAQVAHVTFYIESFERFAIYQDTSPVDWGAIWRTVEKVTPEEWDALKNNLKQTYERINKLFRENKMWNEDTIGGALSIVVHTAYHLGEIRQALCVLKV